MGSRAIDRIVVVCPTDHLRNQWAQAAAAAGIALDANLPNSVGPVRADVAGYVTTYAQVAQKPLLHRRRVEAKRTLVILDEVHHAGDGLSLGRGGGGGVRAGPPPPVPDRNPVPLAGRRAHPFRALRDRSHRRRAARDCARCRISPTATARRWLTGSSGRSSSPRTAGRRGGVPARVRWSRRRCRAADRVHGGAGVAYRARSRAAVGFPTSSPPWMTG